MSSDSSDPNRLSIGAVSDATGIPKATLRTWERRYGFPNPNRTSSGHRRYDPSVVGRLELIARVLDAGYRPSNIIPLSEEKLRDRLQTVAEPESDGSERTSGTPPAEAREGGDEESQGRQPPWLERWIGFVRHLDGSALLSGMRDAWNRLGGLAFLQKRATPFMRRIGEMWTAGDLDVVHEHHASELLCDFLASHWRPLSDRSAGPRVACACLPGEPHIGGLHMAATVLAMAGWQVVYLGSNTPHDEIAGILDDQRLAAVAVSVSAVQEGKQSRERLRRLRADLPEETELIVGGSGARNLPERVRTFSSLEDLYRWAFDATNDSEDIEERP